MDALCGGEEVWARWWVVAVWYVLPESIVVVCSCVGWPSFLDHLARRRGGDMCGSLAGWLAGWLVGKT